MISKISVKKAYTVLVGVVLVIVLGVVSLTRMTADLLPNMSFQYALVITTYPGASPEEVESSVTAPIEASMATTSNIKNISSMSYNSYSVVVLEYEQTANMDSVTIEVQGDLDQLEGTLPDNVGSPLIMQIDPDMLPVMIASADVDGMDATGITEYVEDEIVPELESIEGVASVSTTGGIEETIQVTLDQDKIDAINEQIKAKIDEQFTDAQNTIDSSKSEIASGKQQLEEGQQTLANTVSSTSNELNDKKIELYQTEEDLTNQLSELQEQKTSLESAIKGLKDTQKSVTTIETSLTPIQTLFDTYTEEQLAATGQDVATLKATKTQLETSLAAIDTALAEQGKALADSGVTLQSHADLPKAISTLESNLVTLNTGIATVQSGITQVGEGKVTLNNALAELNKNEILGSIQMGSTSAQLASGESSLDEAQTKLDESKESAYDSADLNSILSLDTITGLLTAENFDMPAGYVTEDNVKYLVRVGDEIADMDELSDMTLIDLHMDGIDPIKLSDIATIEMVDNSAEVYAKVNGNPAIMLTMEKQTGYSTGDVSDRLGERFESLMNGDENLHIATLMDQGIYIDMIVDSVLQNMIIGAILAIIILLIFLKDGKPTIVIGCSIPLSVIFAIVLMYFTGITLNVISMSGLALGIGMLVDNSIVVIENIYRLRNQGLSVKKAAVEGAHQVTGAIVASTLTTVCVFAPIIFTEGITRQLFVDMALTIAYTLGASLIVALTFVPMMASKVLKNTKEKRHPLLEKVQNGYGSFLHGALRFKPIVFLAAAGLLVVSILAAVSRGTAFMPSMESTQATITLTPKEDVDFEELTAMSDDVIERISDISDIETIGAMAGGGGTMSMMGGGDEGSVSMYLILSEDATMSNAELTREIEKRTEDMDCDIAVSTEMMDMSSMMGSGISVEIKGNDLEKLQSIAKDVAAIVEQTDGTIDVADGLDNMEPEFTVTVDKDKASEYNMTVAQVYQMIYEKMADSTSTTTISTDVKNYEVYVDTSEQEELTRADIKDMTFTYTNKDGEEEEIPLSDIASFEEGESLTTINRDSQTRYITVSAGIADGHNVGLVSNDIQKQLDKYECPEGYSISMTGEDETINEALSQVGLMLILAVVFIYLIMVAQFQSLLSPFIIMFTIPLAFTGGFLGLYLTGNEISVIAMIGFVMLAGVIVNNGIVMVDYINQLRRSGEDKREAIVEAGKTRLRPILMTALTTILAMIPMAIGMGSGAEMMQPMAVVVIGGLTYGTLLTLIVVPCIYDAFNRNKSMVEEEL